MRLLPQNFRSRLFVTIELAALILVPLILLGWWHTTKENGFLYDDAYISFRYAANLANGHGLVWNVGGDPTQGYTNFLFVLLTALGLKFNLSAETTANLLNLIGTVGTGLAAYAITLRFFKLPFLRALPGLVVATTPLILVNAMTGMETVFWAGLIFVCVAFAFYFMETKQRSYLIGFAVTAYLACLTRPETVLFSIIWFALLFFWGSGQRRMVIMTAFVFGLAGVAYALWLQAYFGAILPNSFYIKVVNDAGLMTGREYVEDFLTTQVFALGWLLLPLIGILALPRKSAISLVLLCSVVALLLPFYVFASPLMGLFGRFVLPVGSVIFMLDMLGLAAALESLLSRAARINPLQASMIQIGTRSILGLGIGVVLLIPSVGLVSEGVQYPFYAGALFYANKRAGEALAKLPDAPDITVAYNDVGIMPFVSGVKSMDTVGLNENQIARNGVRNGWLWVIGYVLGNRPDAIAFYTYPDGTVCNTGHGVIGGYYSVLADAKDFKNNYTFAGAFDADWVHIQWFVLNNSPHAAELSAVLSQAADFKQHALKIPTS